MFTGGALACCLFRYRQVNGGPARLAGLGSTGLEQVKNSYDNCLYLQPSYLPGLAYLSHSHTAEAIGEEEGRKGDHSGNSTPQKGMYSATQL
jgi:hypothetical protein